MMANVSVGGGGGGESQNHSVSQITCEYHALSWLTALNPKLYHDLQWRIERYLLWGNTINIMHSGSLLP